MSEEIVNMNQSQFDRGVLCLSFGTSVALIQLSKYENQANIRRSKSAACSSCIVYIAITHMRMSCFPYVIVTDNFWGLFHETTILPAHKY